MKRQRFVAIVFALACVVLAGGVLHHFRVPVVGPVAAQTDGPRYSPGPFQMAPAGPAVSWAAKAAIQAQLEAFQKDDYQKAIQYQSSNLQRSFPSVSGFRHMITTAYPEFAHYKTVQFGAVRADAWGKHVLVPVTLTGRDGVTLEAVYLMVKENQGYHVDGVAGGGHPPLSPVPLGPHGNVVV